MFVILEFLLLILSYLLKNYHSSIYGFAGFVLTPAPYG